MSRRTRPWSELPRELLELIIKDLFYFDHLRFRAVCKGWRSMYRVPSAKQLPMFMTWHKNPFVPSTIFDPTYKKTYPIHPNYDILIKDEKLDICASNFGWVLFCKQYKTQYVDYIAATSFFFFLNPFTGETIHLPPLPNSGFEIATFSAPPTSKNCLVLNYYPFPSNLRFSKISTCSVGDKSWISTQCDSSVDFDAMKTVVLINGVSYFVSSFGDLATFDLTNRIWKMPQLPVKMKIHASHLIKSGEDLLMVDMCYHVFKLDFSKMSWIKVVNLKEGTLFLGVTSFLISQSQHTKKMADRIYMSVNDIKPGKFQFYSMKTARTFSGLASYGNVNCHCPKYNNVCQKLWIEPPF